MAKEREEEQRRRHVKQTRHINIHHPTIHTIHRYDTRRPNDTCRAVETGSGGKFLERTADWRVSSFLQLCLTKLTPLCGCFADVLWILPFFNLKINIIQNIYIHILWSCLTVWLTKLNTTQPNPTRPDMLSLRIRSLSERTSLHQNSTMSCRIVFLESCKGHF